MAKQLCLQGVCLPACLKGVCLLSLPGGVRACLPACLPGGGLLACLPAWRGLLVGTTAPPCCRQHRHVCTYRVCVCQVAG
jgi:hypothetical protein